MFFILLIKILSVHLNLVFGMSQLEYEFSHSSSEVTDPLIIFVNGFTGGIGKWFGLGCEPLRPYWSEAYSWDQLPDKTWIGKREPNQFIYSASRYFSCDIEKTNWLFVNGSDGFFGFSRAKGRYKKGIKFGLKVLNEENHRIEKAKQVFFVTHSMGGSFAEGMIESFVNKGIEVQKVVHFASAGARNMVCSEKCLLIPRVQLNTSGDKTVDGLSDPFARDLRRKIPFVETYGRVLWDPSHNYPKKMELVRKGESKMNINSHYDTKTFGSCFNWVKDLESISSNFSLDSNELSKFPKLIQFESFYANKKYFKWSFESKSFKLVELE